MKPLLVTVAEAQMLLGQSSTKIYELAADGKLQKRYIGKGTRNFRIVYASIEAYIDTLSPDPVIEESA